MRLSKKRLLIAMLGVWASVAGCDSLWEVPGTSSDANYFFGVSIPDFVGNRAIPVHEGDVGSEWTEVQLPQDLLETAPDEAKLILNAPDVEVVVNGAAGGVSPASIQAERRIAVSFRLAPHGSDPCESTVTVGPFELTLANDAVSITHEWESLARAARSVAGSGRFSICARAEGDFDGVVELRRIALEFGTPKVGEDKVEICHIPPGDPDSRHTITVGASAVEAHLAHGDYLGACVVSVDDLTLAPLCSPDPAVTRHWLVNNPNTFDVELTWEVVGTAQVETLTAPPGDSNIETQAVAGANAVTIRWLDEEDVEHSLTTDSLDEQCPPDADGDGVSDEEDSCPDTRPGAGVDTNGCSCAQNGGCPGDADGDGTGDSIDDCPNTPLGEVADAGGCSCSQRDSDDDTVNDCDDACGDTIVGSPVDEAGCSCDQLDDDGDGVDNCDDLCPATPQGVPVDLDGCATVMAHAGDDVVLSEIGCLTLSGSASGGTAPYSYSWSAPGWEGSTEQHPTVVPTETTTYTLTVTDWSSPPDSATDTVTVTIAPATGLQYTIVNLGSLSSNASYPSGINEAGDVVGYYYSESWAKRAFLYHQGVMIDLGTLGGDESYARDISNTGQIVGQAKDGDGNWRAFLWTEMEGMQDLGTLGGASSAAYAINESGEIVGTADAPAGNHAFLYRGSVMTDVGTLDYFQSGAFDINDEGTVAGTYLAWGSDQQGFLSADGAFVDLGSPMLTGTRVIGINDNGLVIGYSWGLGEYHSFLMACDKVIDLGAIDGFAKTYVWSVNAAGQIVGNVSTADSALSHAVIYAGGQLRDLNGLLPDGHAWEYLTTAFAINDAGQIAGYGRIDGLYRAFLMTPVE